MLDGVAVRGAGVGFADPDQVWGTVLLVIGAELVGYDFQGAVDGGFCLDVAHSFGALWSFDRVPQASGDQRLDVLIFGSLLRRQGCLVVCDRAANRLGTDEFTQGQAGFVGQNGNVVFCSKGLDTRRQNIVLLQLSLQRSRRVALSGFI